MDGNVVWRDASHFRRSPSIDIEKPDHERQAPPPFEARAASQRCDYVLLISATASNSTRILSRMTSARKHALIGESFGKYSIVREQLL
jgi:hypothetical protein